MEGEQAVPADENTTAHLSRSLFFSSEQWGLFVTQELGLSDLAFGMEQASAKEIKMFILFLRAPNPTPAEWTNPSVEIGHCTSVGWGSGGGGKGKEDGLEREGGDLPGGGTRGDRAEPSRLVRVVRTRPWQHAQHPFQPPSLPTRNRTPSLPLWKALLWPSRLPTRILPLLEFCPDQGTL